MARPLPTLLLASSVLGIGAQAFTSFDPTCTLPTTSVSFVSGPDSRGTLDILWSCLFTIIACTWTIQHLNIPEQRGRTGGKEDKLHRIWYTVKRGAKSFWSTLKWMLVTIVAPEVILGKAFIDFIIVKGLKNQVDKMREDRIVKDYEDWGLSHGFFAIMGGFRVLVHDNKKEREEIQRRENTPIEEEQVYEAGSQELINIETRGSRTTEGIDIRDQIDEKSLEWDLPEIEGSRIISPEMLLWLRRHRHISRLPNITEEEIHDKSKANIFVKTLAILQVFWVSIQVIVRHTRGLAISQLELVTTAFCISSIITYIFLINKPQGVQIPMRPILIHREIFEQTPKTQWPTFHLPFTLNAWTDFRKEKVMTLPNDSMATIDEDTVVRYYLGICLASVIFGAIHVAGWHLTFPTPIERELWRISSIITTCLLPSTLAIIGFVSETPATLISIGSTAIYVVARLFLLVETFRSLGFLPPDAFVATWVSNIPSVG